MNKLNQLAAAHLNNILDSYNDETRPWWPDVNEDAICDGMAKSEHDEYVRRIVADATL